MNQAPNEGLARHLLVFGVAGPPVGLCAFGLLIALTTLGFSEDARNVSIIIVLVGLLFAYPVGLSPALAAGAVMWWLRDRGRWTRGGAATGTGFLVSAAVGMPMHFLLGVAFGLAGAIAAMGCAAVVLLMERKSPAPRSGADLG